MKKKPIFIAATGQHAGKTTLSLGLLHSFRVRGLDAHFMKPVGQHYVEIEGAKVDEDVVLMQNVFKFDASLKDMNPVAVPRGFTEGYIRNRDPDTLRHAVLEAYERVSAGADTVVVEGTGHAGVGSVFDMSNAQVAAMLGAPVIIVSEGGIGRPIDDICLNRALFAEKGVPVLGAVLNKVYPHKYETVKRVAGKGLEALGMNLVGVLPHNAKLSFPSVKQMAHELGAQVLFGREHLDNVIEHTVVAAMEPQNVVAYLREKTLVITPGDRVDNILVAISSHLIRSGSGPRISAILLTSGLEPHPTITSLLRESQIPVLLCEEQTYDVSARVGEMVFKINPEDKEKIAEATELVSQYVDMEHILRYL